MAQPKHKNTQSYRPTNRPSPRPPPSISLRPSDQPPVAHHGRPQEYSYTDQPPFAPYGPPQVYSYTDQPPFAPHGPPQVYSYTDQPPFTPYGPSQVYSYTDQPPVLHHGPQQPSKKSLNEMESLISIAECAICSEITSDHRLLVTCGHSFCLADLEKLTNGKKTSNCPLCRKEFVVPVEGPSSFLKDYHKNALAEFLLNAKPLEMFQLKGEIKCCECEKEATVWCEQDEELFCETHSKEAHKIGKTRNHNLVHPSKRIVKVMCKLHPKREIEQYCMNCQQSICIDCFIVNHQGHRIETLEGVFEERKQSLTSDWKNLISPIELELEQQKLKWETNSTLLSNSFNSLETQMECHFTKLFEALEKSKMEARKEFEQKKQQEEIKCASFAEILQQDLAEIKTKTKMIEASMNEQNAAQWVSMESKIREGFFKWNNYSFRTLNLQLYKLLLDDFHPHIERFSCQDVISIGEDNFYPSHSSYGGPPGYQQQHGYQQLVRRSILNKY